MSKSFGKYFPKDNNQLSVGDGTITGAINALNTGLTWKQIDINDVITLIAPYATSFDPVWPSRVWQCGNVIQLDFRLDIAESPVGNWFLKINDPYVPISPVYLLEQGGVAIMEDGHCGGWVDPGMYFVHTVYAINN